MVTYQTELPVTNLLEREEFLRFVNDTIKDFDLSWDGSFIHQRSEKALLDGYSDPNRMAVMIKEDVGEGVQKHTLIVLDLAQRKLGIKEETVSDSKLPYIKYGPPSFMEDLIGRNYLRDDDLIPWSAKPLVIDAYNMELLSNAMNNTDSRKAPVIYVSERRCGQYAINVELLAERLAGIAHVMTLRNLYVSSSLREAYQRSEYNGAAGIYWPDGFKKTYIPQDISEYDVSMTEGMIKKLYYWSNTRPVGNLLTWDRISSLGMKKSYTEQRRNLQEAMDKLKNAEERMQQMEDQHSQEKKEILFKAISEAKAEAEKILSEFDEEMERVQTENEELRKQNRNLLFENKALKESLQNQGTPLVFAGEEPDLFPGERKDLLMAVLKDYLRDNPKGRRADLIRDALKTNGEGEEIARRIQKLKNLLSTYTRMDSTTRRALEELGFEMTEDGKHIKLIYCGDTRYTETIAKTPSDFNNGKNAAHNIIRTVY